MQRDRVVSETVEVVLSATELGPDNYLSRDGEEMPMLLKQYDVRAVGRRLHPHIRCAVGVHLRSVLLFGVL